MREKVRLLLLGFVFLASLGVSLSIPLYPIFFEKIDRSYVESISRLVEKGLQLRDGLARVTFFEVRGLSLCTFYAEGAGRTMDSYLGKEWIVRLYDRSTLVYELRMDVSLGFSGLYVNLSYTTLGRVEEVAVDLLSTVKSRDAIFSLDLDSVFNLSAVTRYSPLCSKAYDEIRGLRGLSLIAGAILQALLLSSLILVAAIDVTGFPKVKLVILSSAMLFFINILRIALSLDYMLGKSEAAPTPRALATLVYSGLTNSILASFSFIAGLLLQYRRKVVVRLPKLGVVFRGWILGAWLGMMLLAFSRIIFAVAEGVSGLLPLGLPLVEEALSTQHPWLSLVMAALTAALSEEFIFRQLLIQLFIELFDSERRSVVLASLIFAIMHLHYPIYPIQAKLLQTLVVGLILSLTYLKLGLLPSIYAHYTLNAVSSALALYPFRPIDSILIALTVLLTLPISYLCFKVTGTLCRTLAAQSFPMRKESLESR